jgi:hypothetical protein
VLNAKERMDPAWRMQVATVLMANAARNRSSEIRSAGDVTLTLRRGDGW